MCIRDRSAINAGWLHYEPGTKSIAGKYWVTIPPGLSLSTPQRNGTANGFASNETERQKDLPATKRTPKRNGKGTPFNPIPNNNPKGSTSPTLDDILKEFNGAVSRQFRPTASRQRALAVRLKDDYWSMNWKVAIARASKSNFLLGENDRGWSMDPDFFLKPDTVTKILEGKYDNKNQQVDTARPF